MVIKWVHEDLRVKQGEGGGKGEALIIGAPIVELSQSKGGRGKKPPLLSVLYLFKYIRLVLSKE